MEVSLLTLGMLASNWNKPAFFEELIDWVTWSCPGLNACLRQLLSVAELTGRRLDISIVHGQVSQRADCQAGGLCLAASMGLDGAEAQHFT